MPATSTGRGAQIVIDPGSDMERAVRGAYAPTLEGNLQKAAGDIQSGAMAGGDTPDGTTNTAGRATDYIVAATGRGSRLLYVTGNPVGNGADLTEDALQSYDIPAGLLANVGDTIHIFAAGTYGGTTDNKIVRVKFGGTLVGNPSGTIVSNTRWAVDAYITRTGPGAQVFGSNNSILNSAGTNGLAGGTLSKTDAAPINIQVTGQNNTNSAAGSVNCQLLIVQFFPAG